MLSHDGDGDFSIRKIPEAARASHLGPESTYVEVLSIAMDSFAGLGTAFLVVSAVTFLGNALRVPLVGRAMLYLGQVSIRAAIGCLILAMLIWIARRLVLMHHRRDL